MKQAGKAGPSKVDGITSLDGIADHFGTIYKNIYNQDIFTPEVQKKGRNSILSN